MFASRFLPFIQKYNIIKTLLLFPSKRCGMQKKSVTSGQAIVPPNEAQKILYIKCVQEMQRCVF